MKPRLAWLRQQVVIFIFGSPELDLQLLGYEILINMNVVYAEKGNEELIKKFNAALSDYKKSGEYKRLIKFYFGDIEKQS